MELLIQSEYIFLFLQGPRGPDGLPGEKGPPGEGIQGQKVVLRKFFFLTLWAKSAVVSKLFKVTDHSTGIKCQLMDLGLLNHCAL